MSNPIFITCPQCGDPAEVVQRITLAGSPAPVEHVKIICPDHHWFTLTVDSLSAADQALLAGDREAVESSPVAGSRGAVLVGAGR